MAEELAAPWRGPLVKDRVAVVTGGAGSIATATAIALAEHGADVVIADIDADRTAATVAEVEARGRRGLGVVADLTVPGAAAAAVARADVELGRVDILVNALGHHLGLAGRFDDSTDDDWDRLYRVNLLHVFETCRAVLPGMRARRWGRIVNFSSVEGIRAMPSAPVYTAFKGAIDSFTKSLAVDVAGDGIRVNCIAVDKTRSYQVNFYAMPAEYDQHVPVWVPAGRFGDPSDVASVALFLCSELSSWVVGQTISADGGTLAAGGWYRTPNRWTNSPLLVQHLEDAQVTATRPANLR